MTSETPHNIESATPKIDKSTMATIPKILISTRFSYFGKSGWKSSYSTDPDSLFETSRLLRRFWLFENITIPSLLSQTDPDFHYYILSSQLMPKWAKTKLSELCEKHFDKSHYSIRFARAAYARKFQGWAIEALADKEPVAQVVLDDDDALASDYIATLKAHLVKLQAEGKLEIEALPYFVTFPRGYALSLRENQTQLWAQKYAFINLGLTMIGTATQKNIFGISHKAAPKRFGFIRDDEKLMYIRTLSDINDSRVVETDRWREIIDWKSDTDIKSRFAFMTSVRSKDYNCLEKTETDTP